MELSLAGVTLIVLGLSQWVKEKLGLVDKAAEIANAVIGLVLGGAYQYVTTPPVDAKGWFLVLLVALGMALVPSGLYKFAGSIAEKFAVKSAELKVPEVK